MSGLYLHIPFCKQKCHYCDFHFSTKLDLQQDLVDAMCVEISSRKSEISDEVQTIYFGGGTPSLLTDKQLSQLLDACNENYEIAQNAEITLEANPDDIDQDKLVQFKKNGVNRLSIGVQSFQEEVLQRMNRAHNSKEALNSIAMAADLGFDNITADLIYGFPDRSLSDWEKDIELMTSLPIQHISAYCLTIEPNTVFGHLHQKGEFDVEEDEHIVQEFELMKKLFAEKGFEQYEISNFCQEGYESKHNSAYWLDATYLGFGPSAHSYNKESRSWNISNNRKYVQAVLSKQVYRTIEQLSREDKVNETILTRLRTKWGIDVNKIQESLKQQEKIIFTETISNYIRSGHLAKKNESIVLTEAGKMIADKIAADLFI